MWSGAAPVSRVESDRIGPVAALPSTGRSGNHRRDGFCVLSLPPGLPELSEGRDLARLVRGALE